MVENFILIFYEKKNKNKADLWIDENTDAEKNRFEIQPILFCNMLKQIRKFYKNANIHVICNNKNHKVFNNESLILHEIPQLETNNLNKLHAFGLLKDPAILIDCDILIIKSFEKKHLVTLGNAPYNMYMCYYDFYRYPGFPTYNSGIVYINKPSLELKEELFYIQNKYFTDHSIYFNNDEYPLGKYVHQYRYQMNTFDEVNSYRGRHKRTFEDLSRFQSIHYPMRKNLLLKEYLWFHLKVF